MKNLRSSFVTAAFAVSVFTGCGKKEDPVKVIEEAEAALPAAEQMPAADRVVKPGPQKEAGPTDAEVAAGALASPAGPAAAGRMPEEGYEAWFKKHGLNLNDPKMLEADTDGDGVSNRDEFMADTDPHDAASRPGIHQQMRLKQYTEVRLPVVLEEVSGETARVRRHDGEERTETLRAGQMVKGLRWKVDRMKSGQEVDKNGETVDVSSLTLIDMETNERTVLKKNLPTRTGDSFSELTSEDGSKSLTVKEGQTFHWPDESGPAFKVIDLRPEQIVVQEIATRKMWTIPKQ